VKIPDFIVVKGAATLINDFPLLIVEVKHDDVDEKTSIVQLNEYMGTFSEKFKNIRIKDALIQGAKVSFLSFCDQCIDYYNKVLLYEWSAGTTLHPVLKKTMTFIEDDFFRWIRKIVKDNWDVDAA
jgi:hypothetical protein